MTQPLTELPPGFAAAFHADGPPVAPRDSASVLVLDPSSVPWRVLMLRRPRGADFAPGAWVFPGGSVGPEDAALPDRLRAAALRELWEEVGLLLAGRRAGPGRALATAADAARVRAATEAADAAEERLSLWAALSRLGLEPAPERLVSLTRWITPEGIRRRYDTRFYVARAPRQPVVAQPGEVVVWRWVTAAEALSWGGGDLVYATRRILELVRPVPDATALLRRLRDRAERPPVRPWVTQEAGVLRVADDAPPLFP